jgi:hypothetical protein
MPKKKSNGNGENGNGNGKLSWFQALKKWNDKKGGKWSIPKKGSSDYNEIKSLMK